MLLKRKNSRYIVFYNFKSCLSSRDCTAHLPNAFGRESPHLGTVIRCYAEFNRGRVSLHNEIREGRPSTAFAEINVAIVRRLIKRKKKCVRVFVCTHTK
ncbi:hypothetical protein EVAR_83089_1 [Eumeta japonica]|uniref:Mos1 transposase HTH domain-containing protein n=1 Tax=Eumeta variegata TaxID=151549 RepID=A0A4C1WMZ5_EUMVA|nr:hypothetical protein EVAR_83089_1 [Eumeta japonica]